jgi:hypothetical protein
MTEVYNGLVLVALVWCLTLVVAYSIGVARGSRTWYNYKKEARARRAERRT